MPSLHNNFINFERSILITQAKKLKLISSRKALQKKITDYLKTKPIHWIKHHIEEKTPCKIQVFSYEVRIHGKNKIRTYIFDQAKNYVIVLKPQRTNNYYYLLTAFYLTKNKGGIKQILYKKWQKIRS